MTEYEHEVHIIVKYRTTKKMASMKQVVRDATQIEKSCGNDMPEYSHWMNRRERWVARMNQPVDK
jgi:hypothetical protein